MIDHPPPKMAFWPFIVVDFIFLGLACLIFSVAHRPLVFWETLALVVCTGIGAWSFLTPFIRRDALAVKLAESENLTTTVAQIKNLEEIAAQVSSATHHLKTAQDDSKQTVSHAQQIADKIGEESRAFTEFIAKANDTEKAHLRLEIDKLRRSEVDWIQVLVNILDQVFALHQAAVRSGKPALIEQIGNFQMVCRDSARRVGLVCQISEQSAVFDEKLHQTAENETKPEADSRIGEVLAPGYSYQGRAVRRSLVRLHEEIPQDASEGADVVEDVSVSSEKTAASQELF